MTRVFTISPEDLDQLDRLNKALAVAEEKNETLWPCQKELITFFEEHPTILPYCTQAAREKKRAQVAAEKDIAPFQSLHAGGRQ